MPNFEEPIKLDRSEEGQGGNFIQQEMAADTEFAEGKQCPKCGKSAFKMTHEGSADTWNCPDDGEIIEQDKPN